MAILMAARRHTFKLRETVSHTLLSLFALVTTVSTDRGPSFLYVPLIYTAYYDCKRTSARDVPNKCARSLRPPGPLSCCPRWSSSLTAAVGIASYWSQAVMGCDGLGRLSGRPARELMAARLWRVRDIGASRGFLCSPPSP
ncbi:hypothetical protein C8J57DRAFT_1599427 [Mycena rebaudengoi]|nr:hypothetical protein C8J57DRAFT_1599427 [Mycena rebaudengoi]